MRRDSNAGPSHSAALSLCHLCDETRTQGPPSQRLCTTYASRLERRALPVRGAVSVPPELSQTLEKVPGAGRCSGGAAQPTARDADRARGRHCGPIAALVTRGAAHARPGEVSPLHAPPRVATRLRGRFFRGGGQGPNARRNRPTRGIYAPAALPAALSSAQAPQHLLTANMFKLFVFLALVAAAVAAPKPGLLAAPLAAAPVAYTAAAYPAAYAAPVAAAYSAYPAYSAYAYPGAYVAPSRLVYG
ncbi:hypothetical protein R5R35_014601 [Gryllus longicercus]|uniref:Uncharacterized protein n=2 Tax=Gryllus longicercus TaxID=2509291 RepID=A0AAN9V9X4_9ORTH